MKHGIGRMPFAPVDYDKAPLLVIWETTRSCALACRHCRAEAMLGRDPGELSTKEGKDLIDQTAEMGTPIFILSGGDPLNRPDLEELIRHGKKRGLRMGTIPAATEKLTRERIMSLKKAGLDQIAFSLDAPRAALHDGFRRVEGCFYRTMCGTGYAREARIPLQINSCFGAWNIEYLEEMIGLVRRLGIVFWEVFFLIPTGRGSSMKGLTANQFEKAFERLDSLRRERLFHVKLTEAQHYRRFTMQAGSKSGGAPPGPAVNAGKGFLFVDHVGNVCPSGFLPITAGNVRQVGLADIYREAPIFQELRDPSLLKGKCGYCEFDAVCSGSRARAYAVTGDYLESDPFCAYVPERIAAP